MRNSSRLTAHSKFSAISLIFTDCKGVPFTFGSLGNSLADSIGKLYLLDLDLMFNAVSVNSNTASSLTAFINSTNRFASTKKSTSAGNGKRELTTAYVCKSVALTVTFLSVSDLILKFSSIGKVFALLELARSNNLDSFSMFRFRFRCF